MENKTWVDEMVERLKKTADYIRKSRRDGIEDREIVKNTDSFAFRAVIILILNGYLEVKDNFFNSGLGGKGYGKWRENVLRRDNWTCQDCGKKGERLEVHHIKPKIIYPELMLDEANGMTLCKECHRKTDSYGIKARKYQYVGT